MDERQISEDFAKELLMACYALDARMRDLEEDCLNHCDDQKRVEWEKTFSHLVTIVGSRLMVPLYQQHPQLGRIMEPGPWLDRASSRIKFGFRNSTG